MRIATQCAESLIDALVVVLPVVVLLVAFLGWIFPRHPILAFRYRREVDRRAAIMIRAGLDPNKAHDRAVREMEREAVEALDGR